MLKRWILYLLIIVIFQINPSIAPIEEPFYLKHPIHETIKVTLLYSPSSPPNFNALQSFGKLLLDYNICNTVEFSYTIRDCSTNAWDTSLLILYEQKFLMQQLTTELNDLHILYVSGHYIPPLFDAAGLAYAPNSFAIFTDQTPDALEASILLHEFGHLLKFIKQIERGPPANPIRPDHCNNQNCVMYWMVSRPDKRFDLQCMVDIKRKYE